MKQFIKRFFRKFGIEITRYNPDKRGEGTISLKTSNVCKGNVLLSYTINPFLLKDGESFDSSHISDWHCFLIAQTFLELGYNVDVISYCDKIFAPTKNYLFFIDVLSNMERIAPLLNKDCIKIYHPIFAHWLFHNAATYQRHLALQQRKGIVLKPLRLLAANLGAEYADYIIVLGNYFTTNTYSYAQRPMYQVPNSARTVYHWPGKKNFEASRNNFLWLGGNGLVSKGLDLVLDAFAEMSDFHLYICGPLQPEKDIGKAYNKELYQTPKEKDFERVYYKELYQTANIHTIGWVNVSSPEFIEITNRCIGLVYPSSSEGQAGSVVNCLHAGLIPIISYESGVDVDDSFGIILNDCSIDTIKNAIQMISGFPAKTLKQMSRKAWEYARANHSNERFAEEYRKTIERIIDGDGNNKKHIKELTLLSKKRLNL